MKTPHRTRGRQEIVDGRTRCSSRVIIIAAGSEGIRDAQWIAVGFEKVAAFRVLLQMQLRDQFEGGRCLGSGWCRCEGGTYGGGERGVDS